MPLLHEFKAQVPDVKPYEEKLLALQPRFVGEDVQTDTYFEVPNGRLKLREGAIENALIFYERENVAATKTSAVRLFKTTDAALKAVLCAALLVKVVVRKRRRIYFLGNTKFHFDAVDGLGAFVEVEVIDETGLGDAGALASQCEHYRNQLGILPEQLLAPSYSDLLLAKPAPETTPC